MKTKIGQSGFTLPEIMLSMAILAIISLAGMQVASNMSSNENYSHAQTEISKKVGQIESILNSKKSCLLMLKGVKSNSKLNELAITRAGDGAKNIILQEGISYGEYFLESGMGDTNASIYLKKSDINANTLELVLNFKTKKKILFNASEMNTTITKRISFMAAESPSGGIIDCGILVGATNLSAAEKACLSLGDLATWDGSKCNLNSFECPYGEVMQDLEQLGRPTCVNLKSKFLLSDLFEMTAKNCVNKPDYSFYVNEQGKVEIRCEGTFTPPVQHIYIKRTCTPRNGGYSWTDWSACSGGKMSRRAVACDKPAPNKCGSCSGSKYEETSCASTGGTEGGGTTGGIDPICTSDCQSKILETCKGYPVIDKCGNTCSGTGTKSCDCDKGPVNGGLSEWLDWSSCANGETTQFKIRTCTNPAPSCGGLACSGENKETRNCPCTPVDGKWSDWSDYSSCEKKIRTRKKTCIEPKCGGAACNPNEKVFESEPCGAEKVPVGTGLTKCGEHTVSYWTARIMPSGARLWSGGHVCYFSSGLITEEEKPSGGIEIYGTPQGCYCDNINQYPGN